MEPSHYIMAKPLCKLPFLNLAQLLALPGGRKETKVSHFFVELREKIIRQNKTAIVAT